MLAEEGLELGQLQVKGVREIYFSKGDRAAHIMPQATHSAAEREPEPVIAAQRRYSARERWFQPELYRQFSAR